MIVVVMLDLVLVGSKACHWLPETMVSYAKTMTPTLIFVSAVLPAIVAELGGIQFQAECKDCPSVRTSCKRFWLAAGSKVLNQPKN